MAENIGDLKITLLLEIKQLLQGAGQAVVQLKSMEAQAKTSASAMQSGFTGAKAASGQFLMGLGLTTIGFAMLGQKAHEALSFVVTEFLKAEQSSTRLLFALNNDHEVFQRLNEQAHIWERTTIFDAEDIKDAMSFEAAQGRTEEQIKKTVLAAMNLQSVMGGDLQSNMMKLDMTYEGSIGRLGRLDARIKSLTAEELANGKAIDLINDKYHGFAEKMATTYSGKLSVFWHKVGEEAKAFGNAIVKLVDDIAHAIPYITIAISKGIGEFIAFLGRTSIAMNEWINKIPLIGGLTEGFRTKIAGDMKSMGEEMVNMADMSRKKQEIEDFVGKVKTKVQEISGKYQPTGHEPGPGKSKDTKDKEEELNLIKQQEEELKKLQAQLEKNLGDYGAELEIRQKIAEVEQRIHDLRYGKGLELGEPKTFAPEDIYEIPERLKPTKGEAPIPTEGGGAPDWSAFWAQNISYATEIFNIINRKPQNLFQAFQQILQIAQQFMLMMNLSKAAGFLGPLGSMFGAIGSFMLAGGGELPGFGGGDIVPAMLEPGEGVLTKYAMLRGKAMFGENFLSLLNGPASAASIINHFSQGGTMSAAGFGGVINVTIRGTMKGQEFLAEEDPKYRISLQHLNE